MAYKEVIEAIKECGPLTLEQVGTVVNVLATMQTSAYELDEDDVRDAIEDAIDEALGEE